MKKLLAATAILALTACAEQEAEEAMVEEEVAAAETIAVPGGPGDYEVTYSDGSVGTFTANEDGTFSAQVGDDASTGTITEADGKTCFDADGDEEGAMCWTNSEVGEDGSFTSTSDDGEVVTVRPAAAEG
ncbi:hypothetical protein [Altererythrobacter sp. MF3-039]|uniref:hypothetical protein n=1 Tax=Altererythrobacter sp. MF3-039 TaxID=3252901 RepID=UPI00390CA444